MGGFVQRKRKIKKKPVVLSSDPREMLPLALAAQHPCQPPASQSLAKTFCPVITPSREKEAWWGKRQSTMSLEMVVVHSG
jgi:hypothetical protein